MGLFSRPMLVTMPVGHPCHAAGAHNGSMLDCLVAELFDGTALSPMCRRTQSCYIAEPEATLFFPCMFQQRKRLPWVQKLDFTGFHPKDLGVKIDNGMLTVSAKREQRDGDNYDVIERVRRVKIPADVDSKNISCFMSPGGHFVVKGPYGKNDDQVQKARNCKVGQERCCEQKETCCTRDESCKPEEKTCVHTMETPTEKSGESNSAEILTPTSEKIVRSLSGSPVHSSQNSRSPSPAPSADFVVLEEDTHEKPDCEQVEPADQDTAKEDKTEQPVFDVNDVVDIDGKKHYRVQLNMESVPVENISIRATDGFLHVHATKKTEEDGVLRDVEIRRQFRLPARADAGSAKASIKDDGTLVISVPLTADQMTRDIPIVQ